jgi:hypothetical protein
MTSIRSRLIVALAVVLSGLVLEWGTGQAYWPSRFCEVTESRQCGPATNSYCSMQLTLNLPCNRCDGTTAITRACLPGAGNCMLTTGTVACGILWSGVCYTDSEGYWHCSMVTNNGDCTLETC